MKQDHEFGKQAMRMSRIAPGLKWKTPMSNHSKSTIKRIVPVLRGLRNPFVAVTLVSIAPWIFLAWLAWMIF